MYLDFTGINYWAVLVAALATFFLGAIWYGLVFGKLWQRLHGYSDEKLKAMHANRPPPIFLGGMLLCYVVLAFVMAVLVTSFGINSALHGAGLGLLVWLGPTAAIAMTGHIASDKPIGAYVLDVSCQLIYLTMIGAILGGWR